MKLVMFDIDGTLTASNDLNDQAFVQTVQDIFGIMAVSQDWLAYTHVTDTCLIPSMSSKNCELNFHRHP